MDRVGGRRARSRAIALLLPALLVPALVTPTPGLAQHPPSAGGARTGAQIYAEACATCHGTDGRGAPQHAVGFTVGLPDFTSCTFATREPDADWGTIVHGGGPVRAFDRMMPAFGDALTDAEIQASLDHVRGFCADPSWPRGELNLPRPLVTEKAFPEDEAVVSAGVDTEGAGAVSSKLIYERRFGARNQWEVVLPVVAHDRAGGGWSGGIGDVALGVKRALVHSARTGSILSVTGEVLLPTGDEDDGLGKGTAVFEPFVTFGQLLGGDAFLQFQGGVELPADTDKAANEAFWRTTVGRSFTQGRGGRTWSPMVELLGARELVSGEDVQWDLVPEVQVTLSTRQHVMANVGVRIPLTDASTRPAQLLVYVLWDWFDGGLLEGW